jgi:tetratricopeptide (TPR) repeat protein
VTNEAAAAPGSRSKLSLALIARNEARCLARCLGSIRDTVNEIVLVDTGSTDETTRIAEGFGARVAHFAWVDDFSAARNHALELTTGDWILVLDADEFASPQLAAEILGFCRGNPAIGRLRIVSEFRRKGQTMRSSSFISRLFPRGARFEGRIHEQIISPLPRVNLRGELWHDGYLQPGKSERNLTLLQREVEKTPADAYLLYQVALEYTSLDRTKEAQNCLLQALPLLSGKEPFAPNLVVDLLYGSMELKQWDNGLGIIEKTGAALDDFPDFHLACGLFFMNLVRSAPAKYVSCLSRIESSFRRCLELGETDKYRSVQGAGTFLAAFNLGTLYQVFGDSERAKECFRSAASFGYPPATEIINQLEAR